ncbi:MAG: HPr family phosphocarrier protein [Spirochaetales bacterium]|nr:MAG: HPr family phosphocarrier protein [Spirochaetales bacterium]
MVERKAEIKNNAGIHVRPTGLIVQAARNFSCSITILAKGMDSDARDHFGILAIGLQKGDIVEITTEGEKEEQAAETMVELFETEFDFPK